MALFRDKRNFKNEARKAVTENADASLLKRCRNGDRYASEELFHRFYPQVSKLVIQYIRDEELSKDIIQDVFTKVFQGLSKFKGESTLSTWIFSITANHCRDHLRKIKREGLRTGLSERLLEDLLAGNPKSTVFHLQWKNVNRIIICEALDQLSDQQKMVIMLRYFSELSISEIADEMNITDRTVRQYHRDALDLLERILMVSRADL